MTSADLIDRQHPALFDPAFPPVRGVPGTGRRLPGVELLTRPGSLRSLRSGRWSRLPAGATRQRCYLCMGRPSVWSVPGCEGPVCDVCLSNARRALEAIDADSPPPGPDPDVVDFSDPAVREAVGSAPGVDLLARPATVAALRGGDRLPLRSEPGDPVQMCSYCLVRRAALRLPGVTHPVCEGCVAEAVDALGRVDALRGPAVPAGKVPVGRSRRPGGDAA